MIAYHIIFAFAYTHIMIINFQFIIMIISMEIIKILTSHQETLRDSKLERKKKHNRISIAVAGSSVVLREA